MGKHFSESELDSMHKWAAAGISPVGIHQRLQKVRARVRKGVERACKQTISKADGEEEVHWEDIIRAVWRASGRVV